MGKIHLSVGITAHNEGLIAHKTILSVMEALKKVDVLYEIIVHIDDGDRETLEYFERYRDDKIFKIIHNTFNSFAKSRNKIVEEAHGEIVGFVCAGDLVSENWFAEVIKKLDNSERGVVVHPEMCLIFGDGEITLWPQHKSSANDLLVLCGNNKWSSMCAARKELFSKNPYLVEKNGYGNAEWWFNAEVEKNKNEHLICNHTVQFYRRQDIAVPIKNNCEKYVQWYSDLFDIKKCQNIINAEKNEIATFNRNIICRIANKVKNKFFNPIRELQAEDINIPDFVQKEWKKKTNIEPRLYLTRREQDEIVKYCPDDNDKVGRAYINSIKKINKLPDYVFIVPWLVAGGADKVVLNYIQALSEIHKDWNFAVLTTLPSKNEWEEKLPKNAYIVDFGNSSEFLNGIEKEVLFARLLTQLKCKKIHLINSEYGYRFIRNHKELINKNYKLNVSVFCHDYVLDGDNEIIFDYMDPCLTSIYDVVDNIFTDNRAVVERGVLKYGFSRKKFKVHYQPVDDKFYSVERKRGNKLRILWAGRIAYQKCPEILCEVARLVNNEKVEIDVFGKLDGCSDTIFYNLESLKYKGPYSGFSSLNVKNYDLYLYTSRIDGIPNCLLEAAAAGLPIIAPNVGGIGEFIKNKETGILIDKYNDVEEFLKAINFAIDNPDKMKEMAINAQKLLKKQHSQDVFRDML